MIEPATTDETGMAPFGPLYGVWIVEMRGGGHYEVTAYNAADRNGFFVLQNHDWETIAEFSRADILAIHHGKVTRPEAA